MENDDLSSSYLAQMFFCQLGNFLATEGDIMAGLDAPANLMYWPDTFVGEVLTVLCALVDPLQKVQVFEVDLAFSFNLLLI